MDADTRDNFLMTKKMGMDEKSGLMGVVTKGNTMMEFSTAEANIVTSMDRKYKGYGSMVKRLNE